MGEYLIRREIVSTISATLFFGFGCFVSSGQEVSIDQYIIVGTVSSKAKPNSQAKGGVQRRRPCTRCDVMKNKQWCALLEPKIKIISEQIIL